MLRRGIIFSLAISCALFLLVACNGFPGKNPTIKGIESGSEGGYQLEPSAVVDPLYGLSEAVPAPDSDLGRTWHSKGDITIPYHESPWSGTINFIVICAEFSDHFHTTTTTDVENTMIRPMIQYFSQESGGHLALTYSFARNPTNDGWYKLSQTRAYYGGNNPDGTTNSNRQRECAREMVNLADGQANYGGCKYTDMKGNSHTYIVNVFAGLPEEVSGSSPDAIWSHMWNFYDSYYYKDNVLVDQYCLVGEKRSSTLQNHGTLAHEFGHLIGLPDLYDTNAVASSQGWGIYQWGLMGYGNHVGSGSTPSHLDAYCKYKLGWANIQALDRLKDPTTYFLSYNDPALADDVPDIIEICGPYHEYYLIECRFNEGLVDNGVLVYHIDEDAARRDDYKINTDRAHYTVDIVEANEYQNYERLRTDPISFSYWYEICWKQGDVFNTVSNPSSNWWDGINSKFSMTVSIVNEVEGSCQLSIDLPDPDDPDAPNCEDCHEVGYLEGVLIVLPAAGLMFYFYVRISLRKKGRKTSMVGGLALLFAVAFALPALSNNSINAAGNAQDLAFNASSPGASGIGDIGMTYRYVLNNSVEYIGDVTYSRSNDTYNVLLTYNSSDAYITSRWSIDRLTKLISNSTGQFPNGTHDPFLSGNEYLRIGSHFISGAAFHDLVYEVIDNETLDLPGIGLVNSWKCYNDVFGSHAWYSQDRHILVKAIFTTYADDSPTVSTIDAIGTTVDLNDDDKSAPVIVALYNPIITDATSGFYRWTVTDDSYFFNLSVYLDGVLVSAFEKVGNYSIPTAIGLHTFMIIAEDNDNDRPNDRLKSVHIDEIMVIDDDDTGPVITCDIEGVTRNQNGHFIIQFNIQSFDIESGLDLSTLSIIFDDVSFSTLGIHVITVPTILGKEINVAISNADNDRGPSDQERSEVTIDLTLAVSQAIGEEISILAIFLDSLSDAAWSSPDYRLEMDHMILEIQERYADGDFSCAWSMLLHAIKPKLTGLKTDDLENPWGNGIFKHPWIVDVEVQEACRLIVNRILASFLLVMF